jgi:hypothetical protein
MQYPPALAVETSLLYGDVVAKEVGMQNTLFFHEMKWNVDKWSVGVLGETCDLFDAETV